MLIVADYKFIFISKSGDFIDVTNVTLKASQRRCYRYKMQDLDFVVAHLRLPPNVSIFNYGLVSFGSVQDQVDIILSNLNIVKFEKLIS